MKTLVFGSLNIDYVYAVDHILQEKETMSSLGMQVFCGGKGMNQAIAFAKAGASVTMAGKIGKDGLFLLEECKKNNVDVSGICISDEKSGHTIIQVDKKGENAILLFGGSNVSQQKSHIDLVLEGFEQGDYLMLQNEINELSYIIDKAYEKGMKIILNPSPYNENLSKCDFQKISCFIVNEVEAKQMVNEVEPDEIRTAFLKQYKNAAVVLTLGEKGAFYCDEANYIFQPAILTKVVDTTGAGDTFTGYFFTGMQKNESPKDALLLAAKASSIAVSRKGAAASIPWANEI